MKRKNVVYLFCDELRQDALECYGNPAGLMLTPHIDSIAARGILYKNCFCNSPVCVPSRTSLMTGLYPEATSVYDNEACDPGFRLPAKLTTFPQELARAGWHTANFGKTHLPPELAPFELDNQDGSQMNLGLTRGEIGALDKIKPRSGLSFNAASLYPDGKDYFPERVTKNAVDWISKQTEPFFVRVSYTQPHSPIILKRGYETLYKNHAFSGRLPDISGLSQFERSFAEAVGLDTLTQEEIKKTKVYYYGLVSWIDDQVGQILACLEQRGLLDNTVLVVNADHGALRGECRGLGKHVFNRASQAVPLMIADPDMPRAQQGRRESRICSNIDLPVTLLKLLGVPVPAQFVGCDLLAGEFPEAVYATIGFGEPDSCAFPARQLGRLPGGHGWPRRACIRTQHARLDLSSRIDAAYTTPENEDLFFVDTRRRPRENCNMAADPAYAAEVQRLRTMLKEHLAGCREADPESLRFSAGLPSSKQ